MAVDKKAKKQKKASLTKTNNTLTIKSAFRRDWDLYIFLLLPGLLWFILFSYVPMGGLRMAFQDFNIWKGIEGSEYIGFENFATFINGPDFVRTVSNTFLLSLYRIFITFPAPIILAIILTEMKNVVVRKITQTVTFLPYFISVVVVCGMAVNFLSPSTGIINIILTSLGFEEHYFMIDPDMFRPIYASIVLWHETGFQAIVFIAALMGIDGTLYEAAKVDGASKWQQIRHITLPGLTPTIVIMFILNLGKIVKVGFETILLLYQPATYDVADVVSTYVYRTGLVNNDYGLATAAGLFESLVALALVAIANRLSKFVTENTLW